MSKFCIAGKGVRMMVEQVSIAHNCFTEGSRMGNESREEHAVQSIMGAQGPGFHTQRLGFYPIDNI